MRLAEWGDHGQGMAENSIMIREWLGDGPYIYAVSDANKFSKDRQVDYDVAKYFAAPERPSVVLDIGGLSQLEKYEPHTLPPLVILHPYTIDDCDALRRVHDGNLLPRTFVMVLSELDPIAPWLASANAVNVKTGERPAGVDPLRLAAAKMMENEAYNGLSSGRGKDVVVTLIRALAAEGYPVERQPWLTAYFRAGGKFGHAQDVEKLIHEMNKGVTHRIRNPYRPGIVSIMRKQIAESNE